MSLTEVARKLKQLTTAVYSASLQDENLNPIASSSINTLTLTLYNEKDGEILGSRSQQTVLNTNNVTIATTAGTLTWIMQPADNEIVDATLHDGQFERHIALFEWFWNNGTRRGRHEVIIDVERVDTVPIYGGVTIVSSWGGGTSNSYLAYTHANSLVMNCIVSHGSWESATPQQRAAALIQATQDIDSRQYMFTKYTYTQILEFPRAVRTGWPDSVGTWSDLSDLEERMQSDVEHACVHQALFLLEQAEKKTHSDLRDQGVSRVRKHIGPIDEEYYYFAPGQDEVRPGGKKGRLCSVALSYLSDWMESRGIVRG